MVFFKGIQIKIESIDKEKKIDFFLTPICLANIKRFPSNLIEKKTTCRRRIEKKKKKIERNSIHINKQIPNTGISGMGKR